jgi:hypothetical protein
MKRLQDNWLYENQQPHLNRLAEQNELGVSSGILHPMNSPFSYDLDADGRFKSCAYASSSKRNNAVGSGLNWQKISILP